MSESSDELISDLLHHLYWCRMYKIKRSAWRKKIADKLFAKDVVWKYKASEFTGAWEKLEKLGLI
jgi:hypothetical protein